MGTPTIMPARGTEAKAMSHDNPLARSDGVGGPGETHPPVLCAKDASPLARWSQACFLPAARSLSVTEAYFLLDQDGCLMVSEKPAGRIVA